MMSLPCSLKNIINFQSLAVRLHSLPDETLLEHAPRVFDLQIPDGALLADRGETAQGRRESEKEWVRFGQHWNLV